MKVSPVCFDASTDEGINFLCKVMEERGYQEQGMAGSALGFTEITFWRDYNNDHKIRFHLKQKRKCSHCDGCYNVEELTGVKERVVSGGNSSCQWLRDPTLVRIETLKKEIAESKERLKMLEEELYRLADKIKISEVIQSKFI